MGIFEDIQKKLNEDKELQAFEAARGAAAKIKEAVSNAPQPKPSTASGVGTMSTDILGSRSGKKTEESTVGDKVKGAVGDLFDGRDERDPITVLSEMYGRAKNKIEAKSREKDEFDASARNSYANRNDAVTDITTRMNSERVLAENAETEEEYQRHADRYNQDLANLTSYYDRQAQAADIQLKEAEGNRSNTDILAARASGADLTDELNNWEQAQAQKYLWHQNMDMPALEEQVKATPEYKEALANGDRGKVWQNGGLISTILGTPDTAIDNMARNSLLTDEQAAVLSVLQATDKEKAKDYEDYLLRNVNQQLADLETQNLTENKGLRPLAYLAGGYTAADSFFAAGGENIRRTLGGEYRPVDTNGQAFKGARMQGTAEDLMLSGIDSEFGRLAASAGLSIADIATKMPLGGIALAAMGTEVAGRTAYDSLSRGAHPQNAVMNGLAAGAAEVLAEYLPIKNMFKLLSAGKGKIGRLASGVMRGGGKAAARTPLISAQGIKALGKQAGLEASEEFFTEYAQTLSDIVTMGELSNYNLAREAYIASGMSEEEATRQANIDFFVVQPIQAAFAGAIAGGFLGAGSIAISSGIIDRTANKAAKDDYWNINPMNGIKLPANPEVVEENRRNIKTAEFFQKEQDIADEVAGREAERAEREAADRATQERLAALSQRAEENAALRAGQEAERQSTSWNEYTSLSNSLDNDGQQRSLWPDIETQRRLDAIGQRARENAARIDAREQDRELSASPENTQWRVWQLRQYYREQQRYYESIGVPEVFEETVGPYIEQQIQEAIDSAKNDFASYTQMNNAANNEQNNEQSAAREQQAEQLLQDARPIRAKADELMAQRERTTDAKERRNIKKRADRLYAKAEALESAAIELRLNGFVPEKGTSVEYPARENVEQPWLAPRDIYGIPIQSNENNAAQQEPNATDNSSNDVLDNIREEVAILQAQNEELKARVEAMTRIALKEEEEGDLEVAMGEPTDEELEAALGKPVEEVAEETQENSSEGLNFAQLEKLNTLEKLIRRAERDLENPKGKNSAEIRARLDGLQAERDELFAEAQRIREQKTAQKGSPVAAVNQSVETGSQEEYNENVEEENINERNGRAEQNGSGGQVVREDNRGLPQGGNVRRADTGANKRLRDVVSAELKEALDRKSVPDSGLEDYSDRYNDFADALSNHVVTHPFGAFVSTHTPEELAEDDARVMMNPDGKSGIAVFSDNNIGAVFNNSDRKGTLRDMLPIALEMGGNKLDNFDGALSKFYAQFGFVPVAKVAFNDEYAPEGWNYERDGRPDVIFWMHNGDSPSAVVDKQGTYDTPDTSNLPLFTDYDAAYEYRDMLLEKQNQSSQAGPTEPASSGPVLTDRRPIGVKGDMRTPPGEGPLTKNEFFDGSSESWMKNLDKTGIDASGIENAARDLAGPRVRVTDAQIEKYAERALKKHGAEKIYNYLMSRTKDPGSYTEVEQMAAAKLAATFAEEAQNPEHSEKTRQNYFHAATNMWAESAKNASNVGRMLRLTQRIIKQVPGCYVLRANKELQDEGFEGLTDEEIKTVNALQAMAQEGTSEAGNPKNIKEIWAMKDGPAKDAALAEATKDMQPWYANKINKLVRKASTDANLEDQLVMLCEYMLATKKNPSLMDKWRALQRINLLLNMKTQLRNFGGNLLHTGAEDVSNNLAVVIDSIISGRTGRRTVGHSELGAMVEGTKAGAQEVIDAARAGTASQIGDKYTDTHNPGVNFTGNKVASKALRALDNATSIALAFGDRIFFSKREADVRAQLVKLRDQGKLKINGEDISDEDIAEIAEKEATQVTFQDNNAFSRAVVKARNAAHIKRMSIAKDLRLAKRDSKDKGEIARLRQEYALATLMDWTETVIMPFAKTPANLLVAGLRYSPLGLGKGIGNLYNVMRSGEEALPAAQREAAMAIARGIVGSSLMAIGSGMGALGLASGEDKEDKAYREANGIPDNAYRLGEHKWIDLSSLGPIPVAINLGASIYNELKNAGSTSSAALSAVKTLLTANLNDMTGDTLWDGVTDTVNALTSGDAAKAVEELALDAGAQVVPLSSFLRAIENTIDPYSRETSASSTIGQSFNQTISGIPGLASLLPKKKDVLTGKDKLRYPLKGTETWQLAGRLINAMVNPGNIYEDYTSDPVMEELNRLYRQTGDNKYIDKAPYKVTIEGEEHKLVGEDRTMFQKTASEDAYELLNEMINSDIYKQASDAQKSYLAGKAMDYGNQDAKEQFANNNDLPEPESADEYKYIRKVNTGSLNTGLNAGEYMAAKKMMYDAETVEDAVRLGEALGLTPEQLTWEDLYSGKGYFNETTIYNKIAELNNFGVAPTEYADFRDELSSIKAKDNATKQEVEEAARRISEKYPNLTNSQLYALKHAAMPQSYKY